MPPIGPLLGQGLMAQIFACDETRALKLFHPGVSYAAAEYDATKGRLAHASGVPSPAVYELVTIEDRHGYYLERIYGPTLNHVLTTQPSRAIKAIRLLAELHADLHLRSMRPAEGLPTLQAEFQLHLSRAALPTNLKSAALAALCRLPTQTTLLHCDFHLDNILLSPNGPIIIDWANACLGDPLADVARTVIMARVGGLPAQSLPRLVTRSIRAVLLRLYLDRYRQLHPFESKNLNAWLFPVAVNRLLENIPGEQAPLLSLINSYLPQN